MAETYQAPQGVTVWSADSIEQSSSARALLFESYQQRFAVTADYVTEVIEVPEYTTVPGAPCLLYTSPSPRDGLLSSMPSSA